MAVPWAAMAAGAQLLGSSGLLSKDKTNSGLNNAAQQLSMQIAHDSFFKPIQVRVNDARKAGLHPMYAMGASVSPSVPIIQGSRESSGPDLSAMGQTISQFVKPQMTAEEREVHNLNLEAQRASINRDNAQASYWASEAARNRSPGSGSTAPQPTAKGPPAPGLISGQPDQVVSRSPSDSSATAGKKPMWEAFEYSPGKFIDLPYSGGQPGDMLSEMGPMDLGTWATVARNLGPILKRRGANTRNELRQIERWIERKILRKRPGASGKW